jgi:hypothetical protein
MNKALSIALGVVLALAAAATAKADPLALYVASEDAQVTVSAKEQGSGGQIAAQERGRHSDARLFQPSSDAPVQVVGPADGFDVRDAAIGGAAVLALALLAAAGLAFSAGRRPRAEQAVSTEG